MRELRFDKTLYEGTQVDAAVKLYAGYGTLTLEDSDAAWIVRVEASSRARERRLAGELANYALGLSIRTRREREA